MRRHLSFLVGLGLFIAACVGLTGCARGPSEGPPLGPPTVTVSYPIERVVTDYEEYPGRMAAVDSVDIRARVSGYLQAIAFPEGAEVQKGEVLYQIDPRPYQAALDQAEAQVRLQEAQLKYQEAVYQRNLSLYRTAAVSQEELQQSLAQRDTAAAQVNAAKANLETAQLNLDWTKVTSPINGRIGRILITLGNLVVADQTLLTTVVSQDPMYAYFDVDEQTVLRVQQLIREGKFPSARPAGSATMTALAALHASLVGLLGSLSGQGPLLLASALYPGRNAMVPVFLGLSTEPGYPHEGYVNFVNNQVTPSTGTLQVRAVFANPRPLIGARLFTPGLFVRIRVPVSAPHQALLVPERAIGTDQNVKFLYVVDDHNRVSRHDVKLGNTHDGLQVVLEGLKAGERVVVNGLQHVQPGAVVNPKEATPHVGQVFY